VAHNMIMDYRL